jgi:hypothetical protein
MGGEPSSGHSDGAQTPSHITGIDRAAISPPSQKSLFVLLIFSSDDQVVATRLVRAAGVARALSLAERIMLTQLNAAGYQLWLAGEKVFATFPLAMSRPLSLQPAQGNGMRTSGSDR